MKDYFEYKGYIGSAEVDCEGDSLVGKLLFIRDTVTYSSDTSTGLKTAFKEAVEDYLQTCKEVGDTPDTPCKGSFNIRIGPELHREVSLAARSKGMSLNDFIREALQAAVSTQAGKVVKHHHTHEHTVNVHMDEVQQHFVASTSDMNWEKHAPHRH